MSVLHDDMAQSEVDQNQSDASVISHNDHSVISHQPDKHCIVDAYQFLHDNGVIYMIAPPIDMKKVR